MKMKMLLKLPVLKIMCIKLYIYIIVTCSTSPVSFVVSPSTLLLLMERTCHADQHTTETYNAPLPY